MTEIADHNYGAGEWNAETNDNTTQIKREVWPLDFDFEQVIEQGQIECIMNMNLNQSSHKCHYNDGKCLVMWLYRVWKDILCLLSIPDRLGLLLYYLVVYHSRVLKEFKRDLPEFLIG